MEVTQEVMEVGVKTHGCGESDSQKPGEVTVYSEAVGKGQEASVREMGEPGSERWTATFPLDETIICRIPNMPWMRQGLG